MIRSLRVRLMLGAAALAVLFMAALLPLVQGAFRNALENVIEQRLAADAATLISSARIDGGRLSMPARLPDEEFNLLESRLLVAKLDRATGALRLDTDFKPRGADRPGVDFAREQWPHGATGRAIPHGAVFSLK